MTRIENWAKSEGVDLKDAEKLQKLLNRRFVAGEHSCNGDPHRQAKDRRDKNECMELWNRDIERLTAEIDTLLLPYNIIFDTGTGLWGSLMKDGKYIRDVPEN